MKTVVITGISRGIGKALAERFLKNGDFVIGTSTRGTIDWQDKIAGEKYAKNLAVLQLDLSSPESIKNCVKKIEDSNKKIDILINNAAMWSSNEDDPVIYPEHLRRVFEVNVIGTIDFTERLISQLNKGAHIINISSSAGSLNYTNHAGHPDYKISKAALNMATRILAIRLKGKATVSAVHPGWVKTDMGGSDAEREPEEAAEDIFKLANSDVETGQFWFKGEKFAW